MKGSHGKIIGPPVVDGELFGKVVQREERMGVIKAFLVFSVASFDLAVVAGGVRTNQLVPDSQLGSGCFEQGWQITLSG